jgi:hypothetical protein
MKSLILGLIVAIAIPEVYADSVVVNSSSAVTFLPNGTSTSTDFSSPFVAANFLSAQTGANAAILTTIPFYTTAVSLTGAGAQWIGTSAGGGNGSTPDYTALYAISFVIPDAFVSGSLSLNFEVDNELGDLNAGVYLNGIALPGSTNNTGCGPACFLALQNYTDSSVTADLVQGTNWLYIDGVNLGQEGGLIFSATISTVNSTGVTPEPSSYCLTLIGLGLLVLVRKGLVAAFR